MAGCLSLGSFDTTKAAIDAAQNRQLDAFQNDLTSEACDTLGTEEAMAAIREKLGRYARIEIRKPLLIGSKDDAEWTYKTIVAGVPRKGLRAEEVYTVFVRCELVAIPTDYTFVPEECTATWYDASGVPQQSCSPGAPVHYSVGLIETCGVERITE